ncbi:protein of unknown function [Rhodovastum atsumiense]|nr:hypothetical protein [Rhodovastum atsumiense]CAH2603242.1 protein of unknown function [Rhodovastum atsumiense]
MASHPGDPLIRDILLQLADEYEAVAREGGDVAGESNSPAAAPGSAPG